MLGAWYEVVTRLVFYPRMMWRIVARQAAGSEQHLQSLPAPLFGIFPLVVVTTVIRTTCAG